MSIETYNPHRLLSKILALFMVCVMAISNVGCQAVTGSENTNADITIQENQIEKDKEDIKLTEATTYEAQPITITAEAQTKALKELEEAIETISENGISSNKEFKELKVAVENIASLQSESVEQASIIEVALSEQTLSKEAKELAKERQQAFNRTIQETNDKAEIILGSLDIAIGEKDTEAIIENSNELLALLQTDIKPASYGTTLPNEATEYEAEEEDIETKLKQSEEEINSVATAIDTESKTVKGAMEIQMSDAMKAKAEELETPLEVYQYLKNTMQYEYYYGSRKGSVGTYNSNGGNDADQASLLIAMLRYLGYEARYVTGTISITPEQAISLTGASDAKIASNVLACGGTPVTSMMIGDTVNTIQVEHIWVEVNVPYSDYRGAGSATGEMVWIPLDTTIKEYEAVANIYDVLQENGMEEEVATYLQSGNLEGLTELTDKYAENLSADVEENDIYARKRIIKQEELEYLPLTLQYEIIKETSRALAIDTNKMDKVGFKIDGKSLGNAYTPTLTGKDIILSYRPATEVDAEIIESYGSIFTVPSYMAHVKPVILIDGEVLGEGNPVAIGTNQTFVMELTSGGKEEQVVNDATAGSFYCVTLDTQTITGEELNASYEDCATLAETVTEGNIYTEEYTGKLLSFAGRLYFSQVDIADIMTAEQLDVAMTRQLSEAITGYAVQTTYIAGMPVGIKEGSLFIDVDKDVHSVVSLTGDKDVARQYMLTTGMLSSQYESIVWEEITGYESVSTISILAKAGEENIDILFVTKDNIEEIKSLNIDKYVKEDIEQSINAGKVVIVPSETVTIGDWSGSGYMVIDPESGAAAYMISGGLCGGSTSILVAINVLLSTFLDSLLLAETVIVLVYMVGVLLTAATLGVGILAVAVIAFLVWMISLMASNITHTFDLYYEYCLTGDEDIANQIYSETAWSGAITLVCIAIGALVKKAVGALKETRIAKYTERQIQKILKNIKGDEFKTNPLRMAYESEVEALAQYGDELLASGKSEEEVAKILYQARRDLGIKYKDATPQPLRDYIYEINIGRYEDPLGPSFESLAKKKSYYEIIESSSSPNTDIDKLLSGFEKWLREQ